MIQANHLLSVPADYQPLPVSVPPMLAEAIGYAPAQYNADFVSFYYGPGDEVYWDNGLVATTGSYYTFRFFTEHRKVVPYLVDLNKLEEWKQRLEERGLGYLATDDGVSRAFAPSYNLGSAESENEYRLMLDLRTRQLFILSDQVARDLLHRQWWPGGVQPAPPTAEQQAELDEVIDRIFLAELGVQLPLPLDANQGQSATISISNPLVQRQMDTEAEDCEQIQLWLDSHDYQPPARPDDAPGA